MAAPEREEAIRRSGRSTVPQIFIDGAAIGGCDDLLALERAGRLDAAAGGVRAPGIAEPDWQSLAKSAGMIHVKASFSGNSSEFTHDPLPVAVRRRARLRRLVQGQRVVRRAGRRGLLECPVCGDTKVERALMTPSVPRKGNARRAVAAVPTRRPQPPRRRRRPPPAPAAVAGQVPDHVRAMLQRLRAEVEKNCDYVGGGFADEAGRIHRGESDRRGIYGEAGRPRPRRWPRRGSRSPGFPGFPRRRLAVAGISGPGLSLTSDDLQICIRRPTACWEAHGQDRIMLHRTIFPL